MSDHLFDPEDYASGESRKRRPRSVAEVPKLVPRPAGYHLISNRHGTQGFHRSKIPEAAMARHGSVVTLCGITGRRLDQYPALIPLCDECEKKHSG